MYPFIKWGWPTYLSGIINPLENRVWHVGRGDYSFNLMTLKIEW